MFKLMGKKIITILCSQNFLIWTYNVFTDNSMSNTEAVAMVKEREITTDRSRPTDEIKKKKKKKKGLKIIIMPYSEMSIFFVGVSKRPGPKVIKLFHT